jgi:hypothetical protein
MSEMEPSEAEIDALLRRSMAGPVPRLTADFNQVMSRQVRRRSERSHRYGQLVLASYGLVSTAASMVVMRGQGLGWGVAAALTLGPFALVEVTRRLRRKQLSDTSA